MYDQTAFAFAIPRKLRIKMNLDLVPILIDGRSGVEKNVAEKWRDAKLNGINSLEYSIATSSTELLVSLFISSFDQLY